MMPTQGNSNHSPAVRETSPAPEETCGPSETKLREMPRGDSGMCGSRPSRSGYVGGTSEPRRSSPLMAPETSGRRRPPSESRPPSARPDENSGTPTHGRNPMGSASFSRFFDALEPLSAAQLCCCEGDPNGSARTQTAQRLREHVARKTHRDRTQGRLQRAGRETLLREEPYPRHRGWPQGRWSKPRRWK